MAKIKDKHIKNSKSTPLGDKNINIQPISPHDKKNGDGKTKARNLTIKNSLKRVAANEEISNEGKIMVKNPLKQKVNKLLDSQVLNRENLKVLQDSISEFEISADNCEHYICSLENMYTIDFSRLWFLFELEMTADGKINLRNDCYHKKVYRVLDKNWIQSNALEQKIVNCEREENNFNMNEIILPKPIVIEKKRSKRKRRLSDISISIESIIEDSKIINKSKNDQNQIIHEKTFTNSSSSNLNIPTSPTPKRFSRMIPRDPLTERYKMKIFDNFPINVRQILRDKDFSSTQNEESSCNSLSSSDNHKCKLSYFKNGN